MERVSFITTETGDDLILSFAVQLNDHPTEIKSLTLLRTPKYEFIFDEDERGVSVSFEGMPDDGEDFLQKFEYSESEAIVRIRTNSRKYALDVRKVDAEEIKEMRELVIQMNYDKRFQTSGIYGATGA